MALVGLWRLPIAYPVVELLGQAAIGFAPLLALAGLALVGGRLWRQRHGTVAMEAGAAAEIVRTVAAIAITAAFHFLLKASIPVINAHNWDAFLWAADQALHLGVSPSLFLIELLRGTAAYRFFDILYTQLYYVAVMGQAGVLLGAGCGRDRRVFATAYVLLWIAGLALYVALPSWGPAFTRSAEFTEALTEMPATVRVQSQLYEETLALVRNPLGDRLVRYGGLAAFPSLHIAILWLFALASRRLSERWFRANILLVLAMLAGSVVTGYHYLIDGYAGFLLGWLVFAIARRWVAAWETRHAAAPPPDTPSGDGSNKRTEGDRAMADRTMCVALVCALGGMATTGATGAEAAGSATPTPRSSGPGGEIHIPFEELTLPNGLRVVLSEDHAAPIVAVTVYYDVGSRNERAGRTGFAHLFEHMMFQGSEHVAKSEHFQLVYNNGGVMNGTTSEDVTRYFELLPSNQLALGLWLEADRMRSLAITVENLDNQRKAVQEERRLGVDNQPYGLAFERMNEIVYRSFPYAHSVIGSMKDLDAATIGDIKEFFDVYYAPNNAVLVVAGDFDPAEAKRLIEQYFGSIPRGKKPEPVVIDEPAQTAERRETIPDANAQLPGVLLAYHVPERRSPDYYALGVLENLLVKGQSSRLYQKLIKEEQVALQFDGGLDERRGPSLFYVFGVARPGVTPEKLEKSVEAELAALAATAPAKLELTKAQNQLKADFVRSLARIQGKSFTLAKYALFDGDPNLLATDLERYMKVTPADIQRVAKKYFTAANRSVITVVPQPAAGGDASAPASVGTR